MKPSLVQSPNHLLPDCHNQSTHIELPLQHTGCATLEELIDGNMFRVEDSQITASSSYSDDYSTRHLRLSASSSWCPADGQAANSWVQVEFGADVIILELRIGGDEVFLNIFDYYLTEFTVEVGPSTSQLSPILDPNTNQPMVFIRSGADVAATVLPAPIATRVLRIVTVDHVGSEPCVKLEALGCIKPPGMLPYQQ